MTASEKNTAVVAGILNIANNLKIDVIAEGIESKEQLVIYQRWGCDIVQGHYFSQAVPANEILSLADQNFDHLL